jgi:hypothetical protein
MRGENNTPPFKITQPMYLTMLKSVQFNATLAALLIPACVYASDTSCPEGMTRLHLGEPCIPNYLFNFLYCIENTNHGRLEISNKKTNDFETFFGGPKSMSEFFISFKNFTNEEKKITLDPKITEQCGQLIKPDINISSHLFKISENSDTPYCDSAESPIPERVPLKNPQGLINLALLNQASVTASSVIDDPRGARHRISYLNDGWYNNCRSWIPALMPAWAMVDLGSNFKISSVSLGSEHNPYYKDRGATNFNIFIATQEEKEKNTWITIANYTDEKNPMRGTRLFSFKEKYARYIKFDFIQSAGGNVRIDEIEVYGKP